MCVWLKEKSVMQLLMQSVLHALVGVRDDIGHELHGKKKPGVKKDQLQRKL